MYDLGPPLDASVEPGTNLLLTGPPLSGKRGIGLDILAAGARNGDGTIVVTTKDPGGRILSELGSRVETDGKPIGVVDCVTRQQGMGTDGVDDRVTFASSPVDMTGIGIKLSEFLESFYAEGNLRRNRVLVHSISTLLMYSDLETVFRFLHVFTGRIRSVDGLGLFCLDSTTHDDRTTSTIKQLFDGVVVTAEEGEPTVRVRGA